MDNTTTATSSTASTSTPTPFVNQNTEADLHTPAQPWSDEVACGDVNRARVAHLELPRPADGEAVWGACLHAIRAAIECPDHDKMGDTLAKQLKAAAALYVTRKPGASATSAQDARAYVELAVAFALGQKMKVPGCDEALSASLHRMAKASASAWATLRARDIGRLAVVMTAPHIAVPDSISFQCTRLLLQCIRDMLDEPRRTMLAPGHVHAMLQLAVTHLAKGAQEWRPIAENLCLSISAQAQRCWECVDPELLQALLATLEGLRTHIDATSVLEPAINAVSQLKTASRPASVQAFPQQEQRYGPLVVAYCKWQAAPDAPDAFTVLAASIERAHDTLPEDSPTLLSLLMAAVAEAPPRMGNVAASLLAAQLSGVELSIWSSIDLCRALKCLARHASEANCMRAFSAVMPTLRTMMKAKQRRGDLLNMGAGRMSDDDVCSILESLRTYIAAKPTREEARAALEGAQDALRWVKTQVTLLETPDLLRFLKRAQGTSDAGKRLFDASLTDLLSEVRLQAGETPWSLKQCCDAALVLARYADAPACRRVINDWLLLTTAHVIDATAWAGLSDQNLADAVIAAVALDETQPQAAGELAKGLARVIVKRPPGTQPQGRKAFWQILFALRRLDSHEACKQAAVFLEQRSTLFEADARLSAALQTYTEHKGLEAALAFAKAVADEPDCLLAATGANLGRCMSAVFRAKRGQDRSVVEKAIRLMAHAALNTTFEWTVSELALALHALGSYHEVLGCRKAACHLATVAEQMGEAIFKEDDRVQTVGNMVNGLCRFADDPDAQKVIERAAKWSCSLVFNDWIADQPAKYANAFSRLPQSEACASAVAGIADVVAKRDSLGKRGGTGEAIYVAQLIVAFAAFAERKAHRKSLDNAVGKIAVVICGDPKQVETWDAQSLYQIVSALLNTFEQVPGCITLVGLLSMPLVIAARTPQALNREQRATLQAMMRRFLDRTDVPIEVGRKLVAAMQEAEPADPDLTGQATETAATTATAKPVPASRKPAGRKKPASTQKAATDRRDAAASPSSKVQPERQRPAALLSTPASSQPIVESVPAQAAIDPSASPKVLADQLGKAAPEQIAKLTGSQLCDCVKTLRTSTVAWKNVALMNVANAIAQRAGSSTVTLSVQEQLELLRELSRCAKQHGTLMNGALLALVNLLKPLDDTLIQDLSRWPMVELLDLVVWMSKTPGSPVIVGAVASAIKARIDQLSAAQRDDMRMAFEVIGAAHTGDDPVGKACNDVIEAIRKAARPDATSSAGADSGSGNTEKQSDKKEQQAEQNTEGTFKRRVKFTRSEHKLIQQLSQLPIVELLDLMSNKPTSSTVIAGALALWTEARVDKMSAAERDAMLRDFEVLRAGHPEGHPVRKACNDVIEAIRKAPRPDATSSSGEASSSSPSQAAPTEAAAASAPAWWQCEAAAGKVLRRAGIYSIAIVLGTANGVTALHGQTLSWVLHDAMQFPSKYPLASLPTREAKSEYFSSFACEHLETRGETFAAVPEGILRFMFFTIMTDVNFQWILERPLRMVFTRQPSAQGTTSTRQQTAAQATQVMTQYSALPGQRFTDIIVSGLRLVLHAISAYYFFQFVATTNIDEPADADYRLDYLQDGVVRSNPNLVSHAIGIGAATVIFLLFLAKIFFGR